MKKPDDRIRLLPKIHAIAVRPCRYMQLHKVELEQHRVTILRQLSSRSLNGLLVFVVVIFHRGRCVLDLDGRLEECALERHLEDDDD